LTKITDLLDNFLHSHDVITVRRYGTRNDRNDSINSKKIVPIPAAKGDLVTCENYIASGFGQVTKMIPQEAISLKPGETLRFTNVNSETPCTMVESNGRAYTSSNWESIIKVDNGKPKGFVKVTYRLFCRDGVQQ
jgi:hypothetical protein